MRKQKTNTFTILILILVLTLVLTGCSKNKKYEDGTPIYFNPETNSKCDEGSVVSANGTKSGCMRWYTFNDTEENETVNMILDHNTRQKVTWSSASGKEDIERNLEEDTRSWNSSLNARLIEANEIAKITGNTIFTQERTGREGWFCFENNSQPQVALNAGSSKYKWLFNQTYNCTQYGCDYSDSTTFGYWTSSYVYNDITRGWRVHGEGCLGEYIYKDSNDNVGIRPVITIQKSILK